MPVWADTKDKTAMSPYSVGYPGKQGRRRATHLRVRMAELAQKRWIWAEKLERHLWNLPQTMGKITMCAGVLLDILELNAQREVRI